MQNGMMEKGGSKGGREEGGDGGSEGLSLGLCCLMTPGLSKDIQCHV